MIRWPFGKRSLSPVQKAERAAQLAVPTQHIGIVRARQRRATHAGLLAKVSPEARARITAKLEEARAAQC